MSKVIGIDLGTTNSCVAIMEGGEVSPNFKDGYQINLIADAMAASAQSRSWTSVQLVK